MTDKTEELEGKLSELTVEAREWEELMEFDAWTRYKAFVEDQIHNRRIAVCMTPVHGEYTAFAQEMIKGEARGLDLALAFPQTQLELARAQIKVLTEELNNEHELQTRVAAYESRVDDINPFGGEPEQPTSE